MALAPVASERRRCVPVTLSRVHQAVVVAWSRPARDRWTVVRIGVSERLDRKQMQEQVKEQLHMDAEGYAVVSDTLKTAMGKHLPKPAHI